MFVLCARLWSSLLTTVKQLLHNCEDAAPHLWVSNKQQALIEETCGFLTMNDRC